MEKKLDILEKIEAVEVSPFLYTRILQKINSVAASGGENSKLNDIPKPWAWTLASFSTVCLILSLIVVTKNLSSQNENQAFSESIDFVPNNSLYHE